MPSADYLQSQDPAVARKILTKSGENTVATVDISLKDLITLEILGNNIKNGCKSFMDGSGMWR